MPEVVSDNLGGRWPVLTGPARQPTATEIQEEADRLGLGPDVTVSIPAEVRARHDLLVAERTRVINTPHARDLDYWKQLARLNEQLAEVYAAVETAVASDSVLLSAAHFAKWSLSDGAERAEGHIANIERRQSGGGS